jgi:hypothetical protein
LTCAECGAEASPSAARRRAMLTVGDEDEEVLGEVAMFCPECAEREFG